MTRSKAAVKSYAAATAALLAGVAVPAFAAQTVVSTPQTDYAIPTTEGVEVTGTTISGTLSNGLSIVSTNLGAVQVIGGSVGRFHNTSGGSISNTFLYGVNLRSTTITTFDNDGSITNGGIYSSASGSTPTTITNFNNTGSIMGGTGNSFYGAYLSGTNIGTLTNLANATIAGQYAALRMEGWNGFGSIGTLDNAGIMRADNPFGVAINLTDINVGRIINRETGRIVGAGGISATGGSINSIDNAGTIAGIALQNTQMTSFINTGRIEIENSSTLAGVSIIHASQSSLTSFDNSGVIRGPVSTSKLNIGTFVNTGEIEGDDSAVSIDHGTIGSFINSGTITADVYKTIDLGAVSLDLFHNQLGGFVGGMAGEGFGAYGSTIGRFINDGTFESQIDISASSLGSFRNTGSISATRSTAVNIYSMATPITSFVNAAGAEINGSVGGVYLSGVALGSFLNAGHIHGNLNPSVYLGDIVTGSAASFENTVSGSITSPNTAAYFGDFNLSTFRNDGQIVSEGRYGNGGVGFFRTPVASFVNGPTGLIQGKSAGLSIMDSTIGTFTNNGRIVATGPTGAGINVTGVSSAPITNTGTIEGATAIRFDATVAGSGVVTNSGLLRGTAGTAIDFAYVASGSAVARDDKLTISGTSQIDGIINFGTGTDTLDFAGFTGQALLTTPGLDVVVPGSRTHIFDKSGGHVAIFDLDWLGKQSIGQGTLDVVMGLNSFLSTSQWNSGPTQTQRFSTNYAASRSTRASEAIDSAVMSELDVAEARPRIWGGFVGGGGSGAATSLYGGLLFGMEAELDKTITLGGVAGYVRSNSALGLNQSIAAEAAFSGLYGTADFEVAAIDFSLIGGGQAFTTTRQFVGPGGVETAAGQFIGAFISPSATVTVPVLTDDAGELAIKTGATYVGGFTSTYTETGSSMNLTVGSQTISVFDTRLGLEGRRDLGAATLTGRAGLFAQLNGGSASVPVTAFGATTTIAAPGGSFYGAYAGIGVDAALSDELDLSLTLDGALRSDGLKSLVVKATLGGSF